MAGLDGNFLRGNKNCEGLRDAFNAGLPKGFRCRIRYVSTPAKPCDPLFSPCPGIGREKTKLASHFLTVSVPAIDAAQASGGECGPPSDHVLAFAMEVLIYSQKGLTTMFVSKADSTGYLPQQSPSPVKSIATTFLWWLGTKQRQKMSAGLNPDARLVVSLFARAQSQYLFPGSADHGKKHVLDDRQLIRWWARVLDPLFPKDIHADAQTTNDSEHRGYMTVPGAEIRSFLPSFDTAARRHWKQGNPLIELAQARGVPEIAPTRCLLPRFPDDPKARFMQDLDDEVGLVEDAGPLASPSKRKSGRWKTIHDLERFWEAMEFRQECSSGRVVGFLWLVIRPSSAQLQRAQDDKAELHVLNGTLTPQNLEPTSSGLSELDFQDSQMSTNSIASNDSQGKKRQRKGPLTGPIRSRAPRLKGGSSNLSATSQSSSSNPSQSSANQDGLCLTKKGYDSAMSTLLHLDFSTPAAAAHSTKKWVAEVLSMSGMSAEDWALDVVGEAEVAVAQAAINGTGATNDLGGLVRKKKRKVEDAGAGGEVATVQQEQVPAVNMLVGRKKAKS